MSESGSSDSENLRYRVRRNAGNLLAPLGTLWHEKRWFRFASMALGALLVALIIFWIVLTRNLPSADKLLDYQPPLPTMVRGSEGEIIYCRGDMGKAVYLIEEGQVVIETDVPGQGPVTLNILGPGQFFGWSSLFPPERKMASTRALKPTRAIALNASQLRAACQVDHNLEYAIVRRAGRDMVDRIKATRQQLADMLALPMVNN